MTKSLEYIQVPLLPANDLPDEEVKRSAILANTKLHGMKQTADLAASGAMGAITQVQINQLGTKYDEVRETLHNFALTVGSLADRMMKDRKAEERRRLVTLQPHDAELLLRLSRDPRHGTPREIVPHTDIVRLFERLPNTGSAEFEALNFANTMELKGYFSRLNPTEYRLTEQGKSYFAKNKYRISVSLRAIYDFALTHVGGCLGLVASVAAIFGIVGTLLGLNLRWLC